MGAALTRARADITAIIVTVLIVAAGIFAAGWCLS
jgi:hypothetical protein